MIAAAAAAAKSLQSCLTLCDPIDGSPPDSPVPGIPQARTLEWVAISSFNAWKWKVKVKSLSRVRLLATPWTAAHQAPPSLGFSRQEYWSGVPSPSPEMTAADVYSALSVQSNFISITSLASWNNPGRSVILSPISLMREPVRLMYRNYTLEQWGRIEWCWELVMDREAWRAVVHGVTKSRVRLSNWAELNWTGRPYYRGLSFLISQCLQEENQRRSLASQPPPLPGSLPRVHTAQMTHIPWEDEVIVSHSQGFSGQHRRTQLASQECPLSSASTIRPQVLKSRHLPLGYLLCLAQCWEHSEGSSAYK